MRKKIVAGNWKMNLNLQEGIALAKELNEALVADKPNCNVVICTPFIHLASVATAVDASVIGVGAENCADKVSGAYTGEVSAAMVASTGAKYVILGHSERRAYYGETEAILKEKVQLALANGLTPIFCIGEVLEERNQGIQNEVVYKQLAGSLYDLSAEDFSKIILAYEGISEGNGDIIKTVTDAEKEGKLKYIVLDESDCLVANSAYETLDEVPDYVYLLPIASFFENYPMGIKYDGENIEAKGKVYLWDKEYGFVGVFLTEKGAYASVYHPAKA